MQLKVLRRLHLSANKLDRIMCGRDLANLSHISWLCPKLISFWAGTFSTFSYMCNIVIDPNPLTALFRVIPPQTQTQSYQAEAIALSTLLARRPILLGWKKAMSPSHRRWVEEVMCYLKLEPLEYTAQGSFFTTLRWYSLPITV